MARKSERGFASMDAEQQREIASKGGRTAHARGTAHEFDHEEAVEAGRRGGEAVSRDRQHMAEIGRKGGSAPHGGRIANQEEDEDRSMLNGTSEQHAEAGRQSQGGAK